LRERVSTLRALFDEHDADGSGALDVREVGKLLRQTLPGLTAEEGRALSVQLHAVVDLDGRDNAA
jgi:hypothetical protein